jgi:hypothetical protein
MIDLLFHSWVKTTYNVSGEVWVGTTILKFTDKVGELKMIKNTFAARTEGSFPFPSLRNPMVAN